MKFIPLVPQPLNGDTKNLTPVQAPSIPFLTLKIIDYPLLNRLGIKLYLGALWNEIIPNSLSHTAISKHMKSALQIQPTPIPKAIKSDVPSHKLPFCLELVMQHSPNENINSLRPFLSPSKKPTRFLILMLKSRKIEISKSNSEITYVGSRPIDLIISSLKF